MEGEGEGGEGREGREGGGGEKVGDEKDSVMTLLSLPPSLFLPSLHRKLPEGGGAEDVPLADEMVTVPQILGLFRRHRYAAAPILLYVLAFQLHLGERG